MNKDKAAAEKIEKFLEEKYGEEFVVYAIGGGYGTLTTNTLKADVYAKSRPDKMFDVEITKDLETIWDKYMNVLMEEKLDKVVTEMAKPIFGEEIYVRTAYSLGGLVFPDIELNDRDMDPIEYSKHKKKAIEVIDLFIKTEKNIVKFEEAEKIVDFAELLNNKGLQNVDITFFYIKPSEFENLDNELESIDNEIEYFSNSKKAFNVTWIEREYLKKDSIEDVVNNFVH